MSPSDDADTAKLEEVDHDGAEKEEDGVTKDQEEESSSREDPSGKHLYLPVCYGKVNLEHACAYAFDIDYFIDKTHSITPKSQNCPQIVA